MKSGHSKKVWLKNVFHNDMIYTTPTLSLSPSLSPSLSLSCCRVHAYLDAIWSLKQGVDNKIYIILSLTCIPVSLSVSLFLHLRSEFSFQSSHISKKKYSNNQIRTRSLSSLSLSRFLCLSLKAWMRRRCSGSFRNISGMIYRGFSTNNSSRKSPCFSALTLQRYSKWTSIWLWLSPRRANFCVVSASWVVNCILFCRVKFTSSIIWRYWCAYTYSQWLMGCICSYMYTCICIYICINFSLGENSYSQECASIYKCVHTYVLLSQ